MIDLKLRRSVRNFLPKSIEENIIRHIIESASNTPSALDSQPFDCVVIKNKEFIKKISECGKYFAFAKGCDTLFVVIKKKCNVPDKWKGWSKEAEKYSEQACAAYTMSIISSCCNFDIGTCWLGIDATEMLSIEKVFNDKMADYPWISKHFGREAEIFSLVAAGYPKKKLDLSEKKRPKNYISIEESVLVKPIWK